MGTNTKTIERVLTKPAQAFGEKYETLYGTLKNALSAAIIAFDKICAEDQKRALEAATTVQTIKKIDIKQSIETISYSIRYKLLTKDDQQQLDNLKKLLADDSKRRVLRAKPQSKSNRREPLESG